MIRKNHNLVEIEKNAPLLNLNHGFLQRDTDELLRRVSLWPSYIESLTPSPAYNEEQDLPEPDRIHIHDAERTFTTTENRQALIRILNLLNHRFGDYHQGLSYVSSFLLLTCEEQTVIDILSHLNSNPKYIPQYWKSQSVASATDAYVFQKLMARYFPDVYQHLEQSTIQPDTYCQKWFVALCVHVLPFEALFSFFENFFQEGHTFLIKFALSLIKHISEPLLKTKDPSEIFALLRLEDKYVTPDVALSIVEGARDFDLSDIDFEKERREAFETHLKERLEAAKRRQEEELDEEDEITDYSTDEEDDDEDSGECNLCNNLMSEVYCTVCDKRICSKCVKKNIQGHSPSHKTVDIEEADEADVNEISSSISKKLLI
jgi:hypothetical protein